MSIEAELVGLLEADPGVTAVVGTRIYPVILPQDATLPAMVFREVRTDTVLRAGGPTGMYESRFEWSIWATSYATVKAGRDAVVACLNGYQGGTVDRLEVGAMRDDFDPQVNWFRQVGEWLVHHKTD